MKSDFYPLKGQSKATLSFDYENNLVRKTESIKDGRLSIQMKKQQEFSNMNFTNIITPKILYSKKNYFEMEFINAKNFIQFAEEEDVKQIICQIYNLVGYIKKIKKIKLNSELVFKESLITKVNTLAIDSSYSHIIEYLKKTIETEPLKLQSTYCHGDLSLSNILFRKSKLVFIDFLDPFFESYFLDIAKIRQDSYYKWLFKVNEFSSIKCEIVTNKINKIIYSEFKNELNTREYKIIELLNFLRIEPYINNNYEKNLLNMTIQQIFNSINR